MLTSMVVSTLSSAVRMLLTRCGLDLYGGEYDDPSTTTQNDKASPAADTDAKPSDKTKDAAAEPKPIPTVTSPPTSTTSLNAKTPATSTPASASAPAPIPTVTSTSTPQVGSSIATYSSRDGGGTTYNYPPVSQAQRFSQSGSSTPQYAANTSQPISSTASAQGGDGGDPVRPSDMRDEG